MAHTSSFLQFFFASCLVFHFSRSALAKSPVITRMSAEAPPGVTSWDLPLPYEFTTVTGAVIMMNASLITQYSGDADKDKVMVDILGQGPVPWSIARFNRGDLSPRIQPRRPYAQSNLGVPGEAVGGFSTSDPMHFAVQAWRPALNRGVMLASVAQNGQQWNDGSPRFYGTVACVANSEGYGYSMEDGSFGNEDPNIDVTVGKAGALDEGNIDVAIAWFPYDQGWMAGYLDQPQKGNVYEPPQWQGYNSHSPNLPEDAGKVVYWGKRGASLKLPHVDPVSDGMLFVTSTDPSKENSDVNTVGIYTKHRRPGWRIQLREDSAEDVTQLAKPSQFMFAFVYIPWTAGGLVGGNIDGFTGRTVIGRGGFFVTRHQMGQYEIKIGGPHEAEWADDTKTHEDGMLLLQVTGRDDAHHHYAKHAFLSYNYTEKGTLMVEARHMVKDKSGNEDFPLTDTDFSFVWIDFRHPLTPEPSSFSGYFMLSEGGSSGGFWIGFFVALLVVLLTGVTGFGVLLFISRRAQRSPFLTIQPDSDMSELGTDLLHSDFKFSE